MVEYKTARQQCSAIRESDGFTCGLRLATLFALLACAACGGSEPSEDNVRSTSSNTADSPELNFDSAQALNDLYTGTADSENLCAGFDGSKLRRSVPRVDKPPFLEPYRDPTFGAKVTRITDGVFGEVNKPAYSTMQAWNADESLMILYRTGVEDGGHFLHDGHSYERIRYLDIFPSDIEDVFWSYKDPNSFYYISQDQEKKGYFLRANAVTGEEMLVLDTNQVCSAGNQATAGNDVQMHSHDDDIFGFRCPVTDDRSVAFTYQQSTGEVVTLDIGGNSGIDGDIAPMVAPSGERFLIPPVLLSENLTETNFDIDYAQSEHSSTGKAWNGEDAFFSTIFNGSPRGCDDETWRGVSHLTEFNLEQRTCRTILNQSDGWPPTLSGTHVSATGYKKPGWVAFSSIGTKDLHYLTSETLEGRSAPVFFSEIVLVNTHPEEPAVCRLAQHRSNGRGARNGGYDPYFSEPHVTLSPSGTRLLFGSDWYDSGTVDAYVVELPAYDPNP